MFSSSISTRRVLVSAIIGIVGLPGMILGQENEGVTILRSDERSILFEYKPHYLPARSVAGGQGQFMFYDFAGSIPTHTPETAGGPDLRYRSLPLGFPSETGNVVQVVASDYEDIAGVELAPVPAYVLKDEMLEQKQLIINPARYAAASFLPTSIVTLADVGRTRSLLIGTVHVFPLQYNPTGKTLRRYSRLVIEVMYGVFAGKGVQNRDDELFKDVLLNQSVAKSWKSKPTGALQGVPVQSVLASGNWYRLTVSEDGIYRLDAQYFNNAGINVGSIDPRTIKIYGNGGKEVPENIALPRPVDLVENGIYVTGEGDGQFNSGDYVLFYGKSVRGWTYSAATRTFNHYINHYSEVNYYWLTFGGVNGKRMQVQPSLTDPTVFPDKFQDRIMIESEMVNLVNSGKDWYGPSLNPGGSFTYVTPLPGLDPGDFVSFRYNVVSRSNPQATLVIKQGGTQIDNFAVPAVSYDDDFTYAKAATSQSSSTVSGNQSQLSFSYTSSSISATGWIDWVEIFYPRRFDAVNNYLRFRSPDTTGTVQYQLNQFTSAPLIFNVTDQENTRLITGAVGSYAMAAAESVGRVSEYCAVVSNGFKVPAEITNIANQDLHGYAPPDSVDFIIITSQEFRSAADRLRAYREDPAHGGLRSWAVDVNLIYNEFGGGIPDITAIRDFLKNAYDKWSPKLKFVLLFGQGSYDYKGIGGHRSSYVPTWQGGTERDGVYSYTSDDFFSTFFPPSNSPSLILGRISSRTTAEADLIVEKIVRYENNSARDGWNTRMLFVGDDRWTSVDPLGEGYCHSCDAETLAKNFTPDEFEKKKIYIGEYPTVITAAGRRKPGAYQAIIDNINSGVLVVNYAGHGNPGLWAHESIFTVATSIPQLTNTNKLAVFFAATCNFSAFDDPNRYTGSEVLMNKPDGGAIAVVSATRKVFAGANAGLHQGIFAAMFKRDQFGRLVVERPATAIYVFKAISGNTDPNDQKYFWMGDPTMKLHYPEGYASIDKINQEQVDSVNGAPRLTPIQLKTLSRVTVEGTTRTKLNRPDTTFNGLGPLVVNDAATLITFIEDPPGVPFSYVKVGGAIYRGLISVHNGKFVATFVVPKDILYADSTARGRMVVYFSDNALEAVGYTNKVWIGGTDTTVTNDGQGPNMYIYLDSRSFRSGDLVSTEPVMYVDLKDSNGINSSAIGVGHSIEAWINNSSQSKDLTEFYTSKLDDFREGTVQYKLQDLPRGRNSLRVRGWDTFNNSTTAETFFEVTSNEQLTIADVMNYPNPFSQGTSFTFRQNQLTPLTITVKVYTLAGRQIRSIETSSAGEPFIRIPWDGRDRDGDILANGVYLYKLIVKTSDGRFTSEALGKLAVLK